MLSSSDDIYRQLPRGPPRRASAYEISKSTGFLVLSLYCLLDRRVHLKGGVFTVA